MTTETIYCIALEGESSTGSEWYRTKELRALRIGNTCADREILFRMEVPVGLNDDEVERLVDEAETRDAYTPEEEDAQQAKGEKK